MASKKDMRRADLVVPYTAPAAEKEGADFQGAAASTLPMAAIFTRNKLIGWTAVIFTIQGWLSETPSQRAAAQTPALFSVGMSFLSLVVTYLPLFMPPPAGQAAVGTTPAAPAPLP
ncbi:hypothetical protein AMS68_004744 [Peltaster fructicola]|uniref:Protein Asterix n=1 Tax=Peltaster fructicola TaxID=286661 RepID=A0A6H0XWT2_9PEZI|nr:hypothetical protein AMS68_004744 [Peltaster fructicola]